MSLINARTAVIYLSKAITNVQQRQHADAIRDAITDLSDRLDAIEQILRAVAEKTGIDAAGVLATAQPVLPHASPQGYEAQIRRILP